MRLRVVAVAALMVACWVFPGLCGLVAGLHLHVGHEHAQPRSAEALESLLHGHFHDAATPDHTHTLWMTSAAPRPLREDAAAAVPTVGAWSLVAPVAGPASARHRDEPGKLATLVPLPVLHCALLS